MKMILKDMETMAYEIYLREMSVFTLEENDILQAFQIFKADLILIQRAKSKLRGIILNSIYK